MKITKREIRDMIAATSKDGALHIIFHDKTGFDPASFAFPVTKAQSERVLDLIHTIRAENKSAAALRQSAAVLPASSAKATGGA
jgi:hypothetical protein